MRLARQHYEREERQKEEERRKRELEDAEAARKLQQLEISKHKGGVTNGAVAMGTGKTQQVLSGAHEKKKTFFFHGLLILLRDN